MGGICHKHRFLNTHRTDRFRRAVELLDLTGFENLSGLANELLILILIGVVHTIKKTIFQRTDDLLDVTGFKELMFF